MIMKPASITVEEFVKTATMFYIDQQLEQDFENRISTVANDIRCSLVSITTSDGLRRYIESDKDSLNKLISLLSISKERFKRVITMLRLQRHHNVTSEWDLPKIRTHMIVDIGFMDDVCELLTTGSTSDKYKTLIPSFILDNFSINVSTLGRLADPDDIRRLVKKNLEGDYNIKVGHSFFVKIQNAITSVCDRIGLKYLVNKNEPLINRASSISILSETSTRLIIDIKYGITTASSQSTYADISEDTAASIRRHNQGKAEKDKVFFINILDGAGWVARQSDLNRIHRCTDYLLNLASLDRIEGIINYIFGGIIQ